MIVVHKSSGSEIPLWSFAPATFPICFSFSICLTSLGICNASGRHLEIVCEKHLVGHVVVALRVPWLLASFGIRHVRPSDTFALWKMVHIISQSNAARRVIASPAPYSATLRLGRLSYIRDLLVTCMGTHASYLL